jgi:predicted small secreted protein
MKKTILSIAVATLLSVSMSGCFSTGGAKEKVEYTPLVINHFDILERPKKGGLVLDMEKFKTVDYKNWQYYVSLVNTYSYEDLKEAAKNHSKQIFEIYKANAEIMGDFRLSGRDQEIKVREKYEKLLGVDRYNNKQNDVNKIMQGSLVDDYDNGTKSSALASLAILYSAAQDGEGVSNRDLKLPSIIDPLRLNWRGDGYCSLLFREVGNDKAADDAFSRIIKNGDYLGRAAESIKGYTSVFNFRYISSEDGKAIERNNLHSGVWAPVDPVFLAIVGGRKDGYSVVRESRFSKDDVNSCVIRNKDRVYQAWKSDSRFNYANVRDPKKSEKVLEVLTRNHYKEYAKYAACSAYFCGEATQGYKLVD